jgi:hypothetical protein
LAGLNDEDPFVRRAAADAASRHPARDAISPLLEALAYALREQPEDTLLAHGLRIALRNQLREEGRFSATVPYATRPEAGHLAAVARAVPSSDAAEFLIGYLVLHEVEREEAAETLQHIARYAPAERADEVVAFARKRFAEDLDFQLSLLTALHVATLQRGAAPSDSLRGWGQEVATALLDSVEADSVPWTNEPVALAARSDNPWVVENRASADGVLDRFLSSLPRGEQLTGKLRSPPFSVPDRLVFHLAGHSGPPRRPLTEKNYVQLRDAESGEVIQHSPPPRHDVARRIEWDLSRHVGRQAYLEVVDGDEGSAFAWLAIGRFEPQVVQVPAMSPSVRTQRSQAAAELIERFQLKNLAARLANQLQNGSADVAMLGASGRALLALEPDDRFTVVARGIGEPEMTPQARQAAIECLLTRDAERLQETVSLIMQSSPARLQSSLASTLAASLWGGELLLDLVRQGHASPRLLSESSVRERLEAGELPEVEQRLAELTAGLPSPSETTRELIEAGREAFSRASLDLGKRSGGL